MAVFGLEKRVAGISFPSIEQWRDLRGACQTIAQQGVPELIDTTRLPENAAIVRPR